MRLGIQKQEIAGTNGRGVKSSYGKTNTHSPIPPKVAIGNRLRDEPQHSPAFNKQTKEVIGQVEALNDTGVNKTWATVVANNSTPLRATPNPSPDRSHHEDNDNTVVRNLKYHETFHNLSLSRNGAAWLIPSEKIEPSQNSKNGISPRVLRLRGQK